MKCYIFGLMITFILTFAFVSQGFAVSEEAILKSLEKNLLNVLEKKGLLTPDEAKTIIQKTREDIGIAKKEDKQKKFKWHGDLRVRHDSQWYDQAGKDKADRHRERVRARFGFKYDFNDMTQVGVQLATGGTDQNSTNQTLSDAFGTKSVMLDMAYVRHRFFDKKLTLYAGKFKNPFKPHTYITFDSDLRFEGLAAKVKHKVSDPVTLFFNGGVFPLEELKSDSTEPWLYGIQARVTYKIKKKFSGTIAVAYYDYEDTELVSPAHDYSGNTEDDFRVINPTLKIDFYTLPVYVGLTADYIYNESADDDDSGWLAGLKFGHKKIKKFKDWQIFTTYSVVEANATYDDFSDSDFHSGGTNNEGWTMGYKFGLGKGWEHAFKYYDTEEEDGPEKEERRIQVDLKYKFK